MSEEAKRAIEILERGKRANKTLLSEPFYPDKGLAAEYRDSYQLAITAIKQNEAAIAECKKEIERLTGLIPDSVEQTKKHLIMLERYGYILGILEGKEK